MNSIPGRRLIISLFLIFLLLPGPPPVTTNGSV